MQDCPICKAPIAGIPTGYGATMCGRCNGVYGVMPYRQSCKVVNPTVRAGYTDPDQVGEFHFECPNTGIVRRGFYDMVTMQAVRPNGDKA